MAWIQHEGLDPALLWLWGRPAAVALIQPLAWELAYAAGAALKTKQNKKNSANFGRTKNHGRNNFFTK